MDMRTTATQSVAEILDGLKRNAVQTVKHLLEDRRLEAISVDRIVWLYCGRQENKCFDKNYKGLF